MTSKLDDLDRPTQRATCPICCLEEQTMSVPKTRTCDYECKRCGRFKITFEAGDLIREIPTETRPRVSSWIYGQNALGIVPRIAVPDLPYLVSLLPMTFIQRSKTLLLYLLSKTSMPGDQVDYRDRRLEAALQTYDHRFIEKISKYLQSEGLIDTRFPVSVSLTAKGVIQGEEWIRSFMPSLQGFVAMWFSSELIEAWNNGFQPALTGAGYLPKRIDMTEHVNKICDEIIAEIRRSRFVVADFTGQRGGVYYEAGYAAGLGLPVIWTCREDHFNEIHFDVRQYNCIVWKTPTDLAGRLQKRIEAVLGDGPLKRQK